MTKNNKQEKDHEIPAKHRAILIVDDEESLRLPFQMFLTREGYGPVEVAASYDEAIQLLSRHDFDLIISDIVMEDKSGLDLLRYAREMEINCPVVIITGYPNIDSAAEAVRLGAFDYLPKPVKKEALLRTARLALRHNWLCRENERLAAEKERYRCYLETVFSCIKELVVSVDQNMQIIDMNQAALNWLADINAGAVPEGRIDELPGFKEVLALDAGTVLRTGQPVAEHRVEFSVKQKRKAIFRVSASPMTNREDKFSGVVLVARDVYTLEAYEQQARTALHGLVGNSTLMQSLYSLIENVGKVDTAILITGESGTGKELVAEALHAESMRRDKPLIKVDCTAISENLLESELFGHKKGSFTGAERDREGRILQADGGTLFLDEIGDIPPAMQLRLLRFLQEHTFYPVGGDTPIKVDVRVVAATNADLKSMVAAGTFREDLYYRLKVIDIELPPLRDHTEDIRLLSSLFIHRFSKQLNKQIDGISDQALELFNSYSWPGNVRELEHVIERACVICAGPIITAGDLPEEIRKVEGELSPQQSAAYADRLQPDEGAGHIRSLECEEDRILNTLRLTYGNKTQAARLLGIDRSTLYRKIKQLGINLSILEEG